MIQEMLQQKIDRRRQWHYRRGPGPLFWWMCLFAFAEALIILGIFG